MHELWPKHYKALCPVLNTPVLLTNFLRVLFALIKHDNDPHTFTHECGTGFRNNYNILR